MGRTFNLGKRIGEAHFCALNLCTNLGDQFGEPNLGRNLQSNMANKSCLMSHAQNALRELTFAHIVRIRKL